MKSGSGARRAVPAPLAQALHDLSRSISALDKAVAALCGMTATRCRKPCTARLFQPHNVRRPQMETGSAASPVGTRDGSGCRRL